MFQFGFKSDNRPQNRPQICLSGLDNFFRMAQVRFNLRPNKNKDPHIQLIYRIDSYRKKLVLGTDLHVCQLPEKVNHSDLEFLVTKTPKLEWHEKVKIYREPGYQNPQGRGKRIIR